mmetsp:Transcript_35878/g.56088  ORF Transcript_35878/g.56088 Transcript_35878/m.56088 type:complete len:135 (-) Transcript_35878:28-432(-)
MFFFIPAAVLLPLIFDACSTAFFNAETFKEAGPRSSYDLRKGDKSGGSTTTTVVFLLLVFLLLFLLYSLLLFFNQAGVVLNFFAPAEGTTNFKELGTTIVGDVGDVVDVVDVVGDDDPKRSQLTNKSKQRERRC